MATLYRDKSKAMRYDVGAYNLKGLKLLFLCLLSSQGPVYLLKEIQTTHPADNSKQIGNFLKACTPELSSYSETRGEFLVLLLHAFKIFIRFSLYILSHLLQNQPNLNLK